MSYKSNLSLLVSGFGQFDEFSRNPSGDIALSVDGQELFGVKITGVKLEVSWKNAWKALKQAVVETRPDGMICLGLAADPDLRLEAKAKNVAMPYFDIHGKVPASLDNRQIIDGAPPYYYSSLPIDWLYEKLRNSNQNGMVGNGFKVKNSRLTVRVSENAGGFLCNYVFYLAMHHFQSQIPHIGFVHVPAFPGLGESHPFKDDDILETGTFLVQQMAGWLRKNAIEESLQEVS